MMLIIKISSKIKLKISFYYHPVNNESEFHVYTRCVVDCTLSISDEVKSQIFKFSPSFHSSTAAFDGFLIKKRV